MEHEDVGARPGLEHFTDSFGYCGWCLYHALDWKNAPTAQPDDDGTRWPIYCRLDREKVHAYSTCSQWHHILDGIEKPIESAHQKADMIQRKDATFRWLVPTRDNADAVPT